MSVEHLPRKQYMSWVRFPPENLFFSFSVEKEMLNCLNFDLGLTVPMHLQVHTYCALKFTCIEHHWKKDQKIKTRKKEKSIDTCARGWWWVLVANEASFLVCSMARIFYISVVSSRMSCRKCSKCFYVYLNIRPLRYSTMLI